MLEITTTIKTSSINYYCLGKQSNNNFCNFKITNCKSNRIFIFANSKAIAIVKIKNMYEKTFPNKRFKHTLEFLQKHIATSETIFDLGVPNPFSKIMQENGYIVKNTTGEDIDNNQTALQKEEYTVFTAFEIFEHLLNPYTVLKNVKCDKLLISIPLRLWFSSAYRSKTDMWDRHYHEFEDWQLDWLLEKTGWKIIDREKFTHPVKKIGFRPLLRFFTPRYYMVYAEKVTSN